MLQRIVRIIQPVFLVLAGVAIVLLLRSQWETLRAWPWRIRPGLFGLSIGLLPLTWAMEVEIWRRILARVGGRLPYLPAVRIWFLSAVLRYIPGNIWQPLGMTVYCARRGIRPEVTVTSVALYQVIILLAAAPFAAAYLWAGTAGGYLPVLWSRLSPWLIGLAMVPVLAFMLRPQWLIGLFNALLVKVGRPRMETSLSSRSLLALTTAAAVNWLMWGTTFALFTFGIVDLETADAVRIAALLIVVYPIAYAVGFISFFTPSGFGVREGAFYVLLSPIVPGSVVAVAALAMRLVTAVGELVLALLSAPFERADSVQRSIDRAETEGKAPVLSAHGDANAGRTLP
jgi:uncharacterized membrane protein YbhN (UPF0104 family)